jgi:hypothetical protein
LTEFNGFSNFGAIESTDFHQKSPIFTEFVNPGSPYLLLALYKKRANAQLAVKGWISEGD